MLFLSVAVWNYTTFAASLPVGNVSADQSVRRNLPQPNVGSAHRPMIHKCAHHLLRPAGGFLFRENLVSEL